MYIYIIITQIKSSFKIFSVFCIQYFDYDAPRYVGFYPAWISLASCIYKFMAFFKTKHRKFLTFLSSHIIFLPYFPFPLFLEHQLHLDYLMLLTGCGSIFTCFFFSNLLISDLHIVKVLLLYL